MSRHKPTNPRAGSLRQNPQRSVSEASLAQDFERLFPTDHWWRFVMRLERLLEEAEFIRDVSLAPGVRRGYLLRELAWCVFAYFFWRSKLTEQSRELKRLPLQDKRSQKQLERVSQRLERISLREWSAAFKAVHEWQKQLLEACSRFRELSGGQHWGKAIRDELFIMLATTFQALLARPCNEQYIMFIVADQRPLAREYRVPFVGGGEVDLAGRVMNHLGILAGHGAPLMGSWKRFERIRFKIPTGFRWGWAVRFLRRAARYTRREYLLPHPSHYPFLWLTLSEVSTSIPGKLDFRCTPASQPTASALKPRPPKRPSPDRRP